MAAFDCFLRRALLLISLLLLILGLLAGVMRLGWNRPWARPMLAVAHGPLMICGFLGTLICVERAVALGRWWGYVAPLITGVGTLGLIVGVPSKVAICLITLGSLGLAFVSVAVIAKQPAFHTVTMSLGAGAWLVGNILWLLGISVPHMAQWWIGFLVLTIAGERLELNRLTPPSRYAKSAFAVGLVLFIAGLVCTAFLPAHGHWIMGTGLFALALWLARYDVARFTVKRSGLPRFIALCLFTGYAWLGIGGVIWTFAKPVDAAGSFSFFVYDAMLHCIFLGFVFSMIFAHAPIVFPTVVGGPLTFHPMFYTHVALLHLSLIVRVAGDLIGSLPSAQWASIANAVAIVLFLANNASSMITGRRLAAIST